MNVTHVIRLGFAFTFFIVTGLTSSWAGGSITKDELKTKILSTDNPLVIYVLQTLDLAGTGSATRIGQNVSPGLGGERIGPYQFQARRAGSKGQYNLEVTMETSRTLFDAQNKRTEDIAKAVRINEWLRSVQVRNVPVKKEGQSSTAKPSHAGLNEQRQAAIKRIQPLITRVNNLSLSPKGLPLAVKLNIKARAFDEIMANRMPNSQEIFDAVAQLNGKKMMFPTGSEDEKLIQKLINEMNALDQLNY